MSQISNLLAEQCPNGVEFKTLGEVGEFIRGNGLQKSDLTDAGVPAIHYGQIHTTYGTWAKTTRSFTSPELASKLRRAKPGDLIVATTSEDDTAVAKATAWLGDAEVAVSGDAYIYRHQLDPRYVAYFFQSESFQQQKLRSLTGTKVRRISGDALAKIRIPVPPLEVQREIVRVLDSFSALDMELDARLEDERNARRKQLARRRDEILASAASDPDSFETVSDVAKGGLFVDGDWVESKDQDPLGTVRLTQLADVGVGHFRDRSERWMREDQAARLGCTFLKPGDVLIARMPDPLGRACLVPDAIGRAVTVVDVAILRVARVDVHPRYFMHVMNSIHASKQILAMRTGETRQRISRKNLGGVMIPVPPRAIQEGIAKRLDEIEASISELDNQLARELAARRKQYEYYRDKLLTFKELES